MPIKISDRSPTIRILETEGIELIGRKTAARQDIRPMHVLLLNLMPMKMKTEVQIARLLSHTPLQVELSLLTTESYQPTTTSSDYMREFYRTISDVRDDWFDGMIVTGAPVERMPFEAVDYWAELCHIFAWARRRVFRRFHLCWGAQAALYAEYGVPKEAYRDKLFGVFEQRVLAPRSALLRGFTDSFMAPVSRYTGVPRAGVEKVAELEILAESDESGICLMENSRGDVYMLNHLEYDTETLHDEYVRDLRAEKTISPPKNYFENDDVTRQAVNRWRPYGYLLFSNWMYQLYEDVPYDLRDLPRANGVDRR
ncbi:MAG TPA: homoserine O-succinyltransferase [Stellaceae bacterium]|nr:homoserine O-succinyltransferase [Stellaceae bacterium]